MSTYPFDERLEQAILDAVIELSPMTPELDHIPLLVRALVYAVEEHRVAQHYPPIAPRCVYEREQHLHIYYQYGSRVISFRIDRTYPETRLRYGEGPWVHLSWHTLHIPLHWLFTQKEWPEHA